MRCLLLPPLLALLPVEALGVCSPGDLYKKPTGLQASTDGDTMKADILCGEDAALAAARVVTHRKHATQDGEKALAFAKRLEAVLQQEAERGEIGYLAPDVLDAGKSTQRPRQLKTGGQYSRRANEHQKKGEFKEAVADLLRALMRPNMDETARDKLMSTLEDFLKKSAKQRAKKSEDGDLAELFEAFDMEDTGDDNSKIDYAALKRSYRELSIKYHPDKNPEAAERFNKIRDAYEILSDPVKTLLYDTGGSEMVKKFEKDDGGDLPRTESKDMRITVDLKDIYTGKTTSLPRSRRVVCRSCRMYPDMPRCKKCRKCPGEKKERQRWIDSHRYMIEEYEEPSEDFCIEEQSELEVSVEKGMMGGERVSFPYMASQKPKQVPGDVSVVLMIRQDSTFKRIGDDLLTTIRISLFEALLGFERQIRHLDGHLVTVQVERGSVIRPGSGLEIVDEGMPLREDPTSFGKLVVKFEIDFPEEISASKASGLEDALRAIGLGPRDTGIIGKKRSEL